MLLEAFLNCPLHTAHYFNSTDQYAFSRNVFHDWYLLSVSLRLSMGLRFGFSGLRINVMWACLGVRPPFWTLQLMQAQTILSQVDYTALAARHDVVQAQLRGRELLAAVLALVVVAREDVAAVELHRLLRQLFVAEQANDARHLDFAVGGAHPIVVFLAEELGPVFADFTPTLEVVGRRTARPPD